MANFVYTGAAQDLLNGEMDWIGATDTIRARMVMTNTTADTEKTVVLMNGFTTLDDFDGTGFTDKTLSTTTVSQDDANFRVEIHPASATTTWSSLSAGTRSVQGFVFFKFVTNDADSIPIAYVDAASTFAPNGGDVVVTWNATTGLFYLDCTEA